MSFYKEVWNTFTAVDVTPLIDKNNKVDYVTWSKVWRVIMELYPATTYSFEDRRIPGMGDNGPMETVEVSCTLTIVGNEDTEDVYSVGAHPMSNANAVTSSKAPPKATRTMHLPVMQSTVPFAAIENPTARHISDARMRCLVKTAAMFGLGLTMWSGDEFQAIDKTQQQINEFAKIPSAVRMEIWRSAIVIKDAMAADDMGTALEAYRELNEEESKLLWVAESKGGYLTHTEKKELRTANFDELHVERDEE